MLNAFNLDIKNYIEEIVQKRTDPTINRVMDTLRKVQRLEVTIRQVNDEFNTHKVYTKSQFKQYITTKDFKEKFSDFHKQVTNEMNNHQRSLMKLDDQLDDFDNKIKQNKFEIERIWRLYDASKKQVDDCIRFSSRSIDQTMENN